MDEGPFWRAILARPEDDVPRLIFADWLDEQGDPRGEFLRVECALAQRTLTASQRQVLEKSRQQLWTENYETWVEAPFIAYGLRSVEFRRGIVTGWTCTAETWGELPEDVFERAPGLQLVRITNIGKNWTPLIGRGNWDRCRAVDLADVRGSWSPLQDWLAQPEVQAIRGLGLHGEGWSECRPEWLLTSLPRVPLVLDLRGPAPGRGGLWPLADLAEHSELADLHWLRLQIPNLSSVQLRDFLSRCRLSPGARLLLPEVLSTRLPAKEIQTLTPRDVTILWEHQQHWDRDLLYRAV